MDKRKLKIALSLAVLIPCVLYAAGIIAQFIININAWKAAGSDYRISPGLPSSQISEVVRALFHFPEGLIAIGVVVLGIAVWLRKSSATWRNRFGSTTILFRPAYFPLFFASATPSW